MRRFSVKLLILLSFATCLIAIGSSWLVYSVARDNQLAWIKRKITVLAATAATFVDADTFARLDRPEKHGNADWQQVGAVLSRFQVSDPDIRFIYTMAALPETRQTGMLQFVVDPMPEADRNGNGQIDPDEKPAVLGESYDAGQLSPAMLDGFDGPTCDPELTVDRWGSTLSGYAPIRDAQGRTLGIVGIDVAAEHLAAMRKAFFWQCVIVVVTVVLTSLTISWLLARHINRPVQALHAGIQRVQAGDFDARIAVDTRDEFQQLAQAFNSMTAGLKERDFMRSTMECYMSRDVANEVLRLGPDFYKMSDRRRISVLFCDLRGMTAMAEQRQPEEVVRILNLYFTHMIDAVLEQGGVVDKLLGDGLMALFGAPLASERHEEQAVRAALAMQAAMDKVRAAAGLPTLSLSVGVHCGYAVVGSIGSGKRLEYTAIGDTVNVASRLEYHTREVNAPILVSEAVAEAVRGQFELDSIGRVSLRGRDTPVRVFTVRAGNPRAAS
jgi:adenylate cyclase